MRNMVVLAAAALALDAGCSQSAPAGAPPRIAHDWLTSSAVSDAGVGSGEEITAYAEFSYPLRWILGPAVGVFDMAAGVNRVFSDDASGGNIICGEASADGKAAATVTDSGRIRVWGRQGPLGEWTEPKAAGDDERAPRRDCQIRFWSSGHIVTVHLENSRILLFDLDGGAWHDLTGFSLPKDSVSPAGRELILRNEDEHGIVVYNLSSRTQRLVFRGEGADWDEPGKAIIVTYRDEKDNPVVEYREASAGRLLWRRVKFYMVGHTSSDGKWFVGSAPDGFGIHEALTGHRVSRAWDVRYASCVGSQVLWSGDRLAFNDGPVVVFWKPGSALRVINTSGAEPGPLNFACTDETLMVNHSGKIAYTHWQLWDIDTGKSLRGLEDAGGVGFGFSHDDAFVSTFGGDAEYFWRTETGAQVKGGEEPGYWTETGAVHASNPGKDVLKLRDVATGEAVRIRVVRTRSGSIELVVEDDAGCYEGPGRPSSKRACPGLLQGFWKQARGPAQ